MKNRLLASDPKCAVSKIVMRLNHITSFMGCRTMFYPIITHTTLPNLLLTFTLHTKKYIIRGYDDAPISPIVIMRAFGMLDYKIVNNFWLFGSWAHIQKKQFSSVHFCRCELHHLPPPLKFKLIFYFYIVMNISNP